MSLYHQIRRTVFLSLLIIIFSALTHCGGSSSASSSETEATTAESVAALGVLFSGLGTSSESVSVSPDSSSLYLTLDSSQEICNNLGSGPHKVIISGEGRSETYGSASNNVTLDADLDFCQDSNREDVSGPAQDGSYLYANFIMAGEIEGSCGSGSVTLVSGNGAVRNVDGPETEIYGRFDVNGQILNCFFSFDSTGTLDTTSSNCSDDNDTTISISSSSSCTMTSSVDRISLPSTFEGHFAISTDEGLTVAYDCDDFHNMVVSNEGMATIDTDCSTFDAYGFNLESFSIGYVVSGDANGWTITRTGGGSNELNNRIKMMRLHGYPVLASVDLLYVENFDPDDPSTVADGESFPSDLLDNANFQQELQTEIVDVAQEMEDLNVEVFCPLSEPERVFNSASDASTFLQDLLTNSSLTTDYTGKLMWISYAFDSTDTNTYNLTGFDYAGVNISPQPSHTSSTQFESHVQTQLANTASIATSFGIPFFISNAGIWGEAIGNSYDWGTAAHALEAFQIMNNESESLGANGIIFWEGADGEVVFGDYPDITDYITTEFNN